MSITTLSGTGYNSPIRRRAGSYSRRGGQGAYGNFDSSFYGGHGGYHGGGYYRRGHAGDRFPSRGSGAAGWNAGPDQPQALLQEFMEAALFLLQQLEALLLRSR